MNADPYQPAPGAVPPHAAPRPASQLAPVLAALRRHRSAALLIVVNMALCTLLVTNVMHLAGMRLATLTASSPWPEDQVLVLRATPDGEPAQSQRETTQRDLAALRALPGVRSAAIVSQLPWSGTSHGGGVSIEAPDGRKVSLNASLYSASEGFLQTMQMPLAAGRDAEPTERLPQSAIDFGPNSPAVPAVVLNGALARALFGDRPAVGQTVVTYGYAPVPVIGVVEHLTPADDRAPEPYAALLPLTPDYGAGFYALNLARTDAGAIAATAAAAQDALRRNESRRDIQPAETLAQMRHDAERNDRVMAAVFAGVVGALLIVTACGIVGLASFWVQQRTRQIGIRRALGATAGDVRRYFQLENALLTGAGVLLGMVGAVLLSAVLKAHWEVPGMPWWYLPLGAAVLMLLGQLAVWWPASRAARVAPVVALRG